MAARINNNVMLEEPISFGGETIGARARVIAGAHRSQHGRQADHARGHVLPACVRGEKFGGVAVHVTRRLLALLPEPIHQRIEIAADKPADRGVVIGERLSCAGDAFGPRFAGLCARLFQRGVQFLRVGSTFAGALRVGHTRSGLVGGVVCAALLALQILDARAQPLAPVEQFPERVPRRRVGRIAAADRPGVHAPEPTRRFG
jgi:hypothetical protein